MSNRESQRHNVINDAESVATSIAADMLSHTICEHYTDSDTGYYVCRAYIGTVFTLDPCGRYHHVFTDDISDPDVENCYEFWQVLEETLDSYGLILESGDDPCDVFVTRILSE
jgi:hypothetical protein